MQFFLPHSVYTEQVQQFATPVIDADFVGGGGTAKNSWRRRPPHILCPHTTLQHSDNGRRDKNYLAPGNNGTHCESLQCSTEILPPNLWIRTPGGITRKKKRGD